MAPNYTTPNWFLIESLVHLFPAKIDLFTVGHIPFVPKNDPFFRGTSSLLPRGDVQKSEKKLFQTAYRITRTVRLFAISVIIRHFGILGQTETTQQKRHSTKTG